MANVSVSRRGTSLSAWCDHPAFRKGFDDARAGRDFAPEYEERSSAWQWMYESGRLFACSSKSARYKRLPMWSKATPQFATMLRKAFVNDITNHEGE